ncbi:flagellar biosynthetic protein FliP [Nitrosomonas cryotolerans]|uniref:Flagellar biosynthetic protein FliP n=1 Tax=Nitrosomonas cryotolerans ATCC 49181 TaxID=1131553 RepID=A0A1N6I595_9PROT|nr:flagellar type III secretion system pore protein FliP [Nitrosomonas cryotolerans]SFQ10588.1 flagellar biosynthetic protein FliP [Nitrosomonas cryotolerans]SIO27208.1 flagellar biosynthetic protein FliP [Nitrosomonas cryotolerans ATCC 49181]
MHFLRACLQLRRLLQVLFLLAGCCFTLPVFSQQTGFPAFSSTPLSGGGALYTLSLQTLLFFTSLTFLPAVVLMMSSFTRIIIVLSLLRLALGTQSSPPNQVLIGLALFLTFFVMSPVIDRIYHEAYLPFSEDKIDIIKAADKASVPLKSFMLHQTRETDLALFIQISNSHEIQNPEQIPLKILVPAYVTSELKTAFQIGFLIFIPFLIIDMVVASVLMSMGMMMLSPMIISLPFKLMLFVLVDGWHLLIGSLTQSFFT